MRQLSEFIDLISVGEIRQYNEGYIFKNELLQNTDLSTWKDFLHAALEQRVRNHIFLPRVMVLELKDS